MLKRGDVVLVTGASRGIGAAVAHTMAAAGMRLAVTASRQETLQPTIDRLRALGAEVMALPADLRDSGQTLALVPAVISAYGSLRVLINNAGIGVYGPFETFALDDFDRVLAINVRAPFLLCRAAIPHLRATKGAIVNIASVVAIKGYPRQAAYAASKHALLGMSKSLRRELLADGVRVHVICPGGVDTDLAAQARPDLDRNALMTPLEVAELVQFLLMRTGNGVIDQVDVRRAEADPWD